MELKAPPNSRGGWGGRYVALLYEIGIRYPDLVLVGVALINIVCLLSYLIQ
jgi:hypothetical protein